MTSSLITSQLQDTIKESLEEYIIMISENNDSVAESKEDDDDVPDKSSTPKRRGGFGAPVQLSNELSAFLGHDILPRTEVTLINNKYNIINTIF
jgi:chromatin remodeling complex protein RSC6